MYRYANLFFCVHDIYAYTDQRPSHDIAFGHVLALGLATDTLTIYQYFYEQMFFLITGGYRVFSSNAFLNIDIIPRIHSFFNKSLA